MKKIIGFLTLSMLCIFVFIESMYVPEKIQTGHSQSLESLKTAHAITPRIVPMGMGVMQMSFSPYMQEEKIERMLKTIRMLMSYAKPGQKIILNTAYIYGMQSGDNERLLRDALLRLSIVEHRKLIVITWVGLAGIALEIEQDDHALVGPKEMYSEQPFQQFINGSFKNLSMDLFPDIEFWVGLHRINPYVSLADQMEQLKLIHAHEYVTKVGLSEVSLATLQKCNTYLPIGFLETEMSLSRQFIIRDGILNYCIENDIKVLAYSPLDRGIWSTRIDTIDDWLRIGNEHPFLRNLSSWTDENIVRINYAQRKKALAIAQKYGTTINQLALAWIMKKGAIPIPDSTSPERSASNFEALNLINSLSEEDMALLDSIDFKGKRLR